MTLRFDGIKFVSDKNSITMVHQPSQRYAQYLFVLETKPKVRMNSMWMQGGIHYAGNEWSDRTKVVPVSTNADVFKNMA